MPWSRRSGRIRLANCRSTLSTVEEPAIRSASDINEGLARIRRRRLRAVIVSVTYLPGVLGVRYLLQQVGVESEVPAVGLAAAWMVAFAITLAQACLSRCPRCDKLFHVRGLWWANAFAWSCLNCKLPLGGYVS